MGLAHSSEGLTPEAWFNCFISGLNEDIRRDVVAKAPADLLRAVFLAKLYEEKYVSVPSPHSTLFTPRYSTLSASNNHNTQNTARNFRLKIIYLHYFLLQMSILFEITMLKK